METQLNDILSTMHSAGIKVNGTTLHIDEARYDELVNGLSDTQPFSLGVIYESDFGKIYIVKA